MRLLFPIASLLISLGLFFSYISPTYADISVLRDDVAKYNLALDNSTYLQRKEDELVGAYKNIKDEDKSRLEHFLPNTVNNIEFILEIEQIANLYMMPIKNIKFDTMKTTDAKVAKGGTVLIANDSSSSRPYGVFSLEFTTEGTYATFASFLKDLEHNLRLADVKSISFAVPPPSSGKSDNPKDPNIYTYILKVDTYWLK